MGSELGKLLCMRVSAQRCAVLSMLSGHCRSRRDTPARCPPPPPTPPCTGTDLACGDIIGPGWVWEAQ